MALFNRQWFGGLQRMFPSSTQMLPYPKELTDTVSFTKDVQAVDFINNVRLRRSVLTFVGTGAANADLLLPEPEVGFFQIPVALTAWHDGNVAQLVNFIVEAVPGSVQDPWGAFETSTRFIDQAILPAVVAPLQFEIVAPRQLWPLTHGFQWYVGFPTPALGVTVRAHYYWIDVPGDVVKLDHVMRTMQFPTS